MGRRLVLLTCIAALSACNKGPDINVKNASVGEVAEKVRDAQAGGMFIKPGRWESKVSVLDVQMPGMPPQMADRIKQTMTTVNDRDVMATCLSEADAKKPREDFFAGKSKNCRYDHLTMSGGKMDAAMTCTGERGTSMSMTMAGTYSPDHYEGDMAMEMNGPDAHGMKIKSHSVSNLVGQCRGDEINSDKGAKS
jgi:hypothetical protein